MPNVVDCPECRKAMNLSDAAAGRRVRCPGCKHIFVAPGEEEEPEVVECDIVEEPAKSPPRDEDEEYARPRRSMRRDEEDEEYARPRRQRRDEDDDEEDRPVKRRRKRAKRDVSASPVPIIFGILSCVFCCIPLFGIFLGGVAINKAAEEIDRLPSGTRYDSAYQQLRLARVLGIIGVWLSLFLAFVYIVIRITRE